MACLASRTEKAIPEQRRDGKEHWNRETGEGKRTMGMSLAQAVVALVGTCARRLSRAARRLHQRPPREGLAASFSPRAIVPFLGGGGVIKKVLSSSRRRKAEDELSFEWDDDGVWRKEIMMGERCQPLDFSGAIHYDAEGRRLEQPPTPRSPLRSPLPASIVLKGNSGWRALAAS
jgi:hypothetical protein